MFVSACVWARNSWKRDAWEVKPAPGEEDALDVYLLSNSRKRQGMFRVRFCDTRQQEQEEPGMRWTGCGDPSIKGPYANLALFSLSRGVSATLDPCEEDVEVGKTLSARLFEEARSRGVTYVEGDIFQGELPFFNACGFQEHPNRRLWVCATIPPAQGKHVTGTAGADGSGGADGRAL